MHDEVWFRNQEDLDIYIYIKQILGRHVSKIRGRLNWIKTVIVVPVQQYCIPVFCHRSTTWNV
jgi:hypothetical protein